MLAPGKWGFYESYSVMVIVQENITVETNNRRGSSYFRGVLIDLEDNYSTELKDKLLVSNFWTKESCTDPNIINKFSIGKVAYNNWQQKSIKSISNSKTTTKSTKPNKPKDQLAMGNTTESSNSSSSGNNNSIPKNPILKTRTKTTTDEQTSDSDELDSDEDEIEEQEEEDGNNNNDDDNDDDNDNEILDSVNFPKKGNKKNDKGKVGATSVRSLGQTLQANKKKTPAMNTTSSSNNGSGSGSSSYGSGLQGLSHMFGFGITSTSNTVNQNQLNANAAKAYQDRRNSSMTSVSLSRSSHANSNNDNNSSSITSTTTTTNQNTGYPINYYDEMRSRGVGGGSINSKGNSSLKSTNHSSISKSGIHEIDPTNSRILNPEGQNSPANSLRIEDYEIDHGKKQVLMKNTPRMAGHSGKHPTTIKTYAYVTDGDKCWLMNVDEHLEIVTALVYAMMSKKGLVGKSVEGCYWKEVLSRLIAKENITKNKFHEIISQPLAIILATSNTNKEYVKKWTAMGGTLLQTVKKKLNINGDGSVLIVDRLMEVLGQDSTRFKTILVNYTAKDKLGDSLHIQALEHAKFDGEDPQEICALFIIERTMQEVGFIGEDELPTKAIDCKDPWSKKYTFHDFILVLTMLTFGLVHGKVLKKPDIIRKPQGKKPRVVYTEEDIEKNRLDRKEAEELLVTVHEIRAMYTFLEERVLLDLEAFHLSMQYNPEDMISLSESRVKTFGLWDEAHKKRPGRFMKDGGEDDDSDSDEAKDARRKRVANFMNGSDDDNDD